MAWPEFDLLGDPVPANFGGRGRPEHVASEEKARLIIVLAAVGKSKPQIAEALGISEPTLRKHYFSARSRFKLKLGESRQRLEAKIYATLMREADAGNVTAIRTLWDRLDKLDLKQAQIAEAMRSQAKPEKLGKKAEADLRAKEAHKTSSWGDLLN